MGALAKLMCGAPGPKPALGQLLTHVAGSLDVLEAQISWLSGQQDQLMTLYGPFIGRSLLEVSLNAILARLDPFRVLSVRRMQCSPKFEVDRRSKLALQWQGDIVASKPNKTIWEDDAEPEKLTRALLGDYCDDLFWREAFVALTDATRDMNCTGWLAELHQTTQDSFIPEMRGQATRLFSAFSKGVHHEFLIPLTSAYDRPTVVSLLGDVLEAISKLGLVSHFFSHSSACLPLVDALAAYDELEKVKVR